MENKKRPIYLDLPKLTQNMSVTAKVSILHRASGIIMFLAIPFVVYLFKLSLTKPEFYATCYTFATLPVLKLVYLVLIWSIMHHMCAGVRFLLLDVHRGIDRVTAQKTARWVLVVSIILTLCLGALMW